MIPISTYLSMAKDLLLAAAIVFVLWFVYHHGGDSVKLADLQAVQRQLAANAQQEEQWKEAAAVAEIQHAQELANIDAAIRQQHRPVFILRQPPGATGVSSDPGKAPSPDPKSGTTEAGPRGDPVNVRDAINSFEARYEQALSDCRKVIDSWPR